MRDEPPRVADAAVRDAASRLREAAAAKKCWPCGCLHDTLAAVEDILPHLGRASDLVQAVSDARARLAPVRYACLGCDVCYPALALDALHHSGIVTPVDAGSCTVQPAEPRDGWPPLAGAYTVLRYHAPVAVCTLTDERLARQVAHEAGPKTAIVGSLQTENLGIERLILNVVSNPNVRFVIVCGEDSPGWVGHLPGQSLLALARGGVDDSGRIIGAKGRRPVLRNVTRDAIEHFRRMVETVDLVGCREIARIASAIAECAARDPGPAEPLPAERPVTPIRGSLPARMVTDPSGYCVIGVDRRRHLLWLEHYRTDGVLDAIIEGRAAAELYTPAIEQGLVSRLDHAAYVGRELARAEHALLTGEPYVQDRAPDAASSSISEPSCVATVAQPLQALPGPRSAGLKPCATDAGPWQRMSSGSRERASRSTGRRPAARPAPRRPSR